MHEPFINNLPNELLTWIFEITPRDDDTQRPGYTAWHRKLDYYAWLRFMLVCRRWRLVGERLLYRKMTLRILDEGSKSLEMVEKTPHVCAYVRDLHLTVSLTNPGEQSTLDVLRRFSSVRKLKLTGRPYKIGRSILEIIRTMPLTEVSLNDLPSWGLISEFFDMPTLTHLSVSDLDSGKTFQSSRLDLGELTHGSGEENRSSSSLYNDASALANTPEELSPSSQHRTSKVTSLHFARPTAGIDVAEQLFLWPARLEEVKISLLTVAILYEEYTAEGVQRLLSPHSDSLQKIEIGVMTLGGGGIPDFSGFSRLKELALSSYNIFHDSPERAHEKLSAPALKRLEISFSPEQLWTESLNDFGENEMLWLVDFIELVKDAPATANLKNIYIRFRPQPTYPPRDDVDEWPWDMFEELEELCEEHGMMFEYDRTEFTKRQFSERYRSPSTDEEASGDEPLS